MNAKLPTGHVNHEIQMLYTNSHTRLLANLTAFAGGDLGLAEDALQEAFTRALQKWPHGGIPANPAGWIFTTAKRKLVDSGRHEIVKARKQPELRALAEQKQQAQNQGTFAIENELPDQRLELLFTCCHPLLPVEGQIALTLQVFSAMPVETIARALMVKTTTMAKRLTRAKSRIREARIPFELPAEKERQARLRTILQVIYLVFNEGYLPGNGASLLNQSLCDEAIEIASLLDQLYPGRADVLALRALMLFHHSRRSARTDNGGQLVTLENQDRKLWDLSMIEKATALLDQAMAINPAGEYQLQAAIASLHANSKSYDSTDWPQIALLYQELLKIHDQPVTRLSQAVAIAMAAGPAQALSLLDKLGEDGPLEKYHLFYSARAEILVMLDRPSEAAVDFKKGIRLCQNEIEKAHMKKRLLSLN